MTSRKQDAESLSGAYALHTLGEDEARQFEAHIANSEETRNEVTELGDTAVLLGLAVAPEAPPASLKAGIMAQLASTPQLPAVEAQPGPAETKAKARWFARPVTALVGAAAAIALIVGGGVVANIVATTTSQQAQADQLAAIYAADDSQRVVAAVDGGGSATLVWSAELERSAIIVDGLGSLPDDKVYELWYIDGSGARPAGTFSVSGDSVWQVLDGRMAAGDTVGVTVEPRGGSDVPTTDPIVVLASA